MKLDNQQETYYALGYLGAAIDGEGTIGCHKCQSKNHRSQAYKPVVKVFNTDQVFFEECIKALQVLDIPYYISCTGKAKPSNPKPLRRYRDCYSLTISGYKRLHAHLPKLIPLLRVKRAQGELLYKICDERLKAPFPAKGRVVPASPEMLRMIQQLSDLNHWR